LIWDELLEAFESTKIELKPFPHHVSCRWDYESNSPPPNYLLQGYTVFMSFPLEYVFVSFMHIVLMVVVNSFRLHALFQENMENIDYNTKAIKETLMEKLDENIIYIYIYIYI
jgi:hypothetical protein